MAVSFIGGGNRSAQRKPLTCRKYVNVLPRLEILTRDILALKVAGFTMMCSARLGMDWHYLRLNEVIICQEHVVLCIHITYRIFSSRIINMYLIFQDKNVQMMNMKYCYKTKVYLTALRYVCFYNTASTPVSSINKTDRHITEILLKVALKKNLISLSGAFICE
jgi:hypothetical protein